MALAEPAAPLKFFYTRLHDAIRAELGMLSQCVAQLENSVAEQAIEGQVAHLSGRYRFLEQVYKYHSNVEDEVRQHAPQKLLGRRRGDPRTPPARRSFHVAVRWVGCLMQVVYPALDAKVKNVTLAYSVEHEDEVRPRRRHAPRCLPGSPL